MKTGISLFVFILMSFAVYAQGVGINVTNTPPDPSSLLDVSSTNKGVLIPRMTEIQRNAIVNPAYGLMILNTNTNCINMWNGSNWVANCFDCMSAPVITTSSPACVGSTLTLNATAVPGASYSWTGPNGYTSSLQNLSLTNVQLNQAGTYTVTASFNGCTSPAASVTVTVNPVPATPVAGSNSPVLVGGTVNLTASTIGGVTYSWTGPNGFTSSLQNPTITNAQANQSGTYSVVAIANGCTSSVATVVVNISTSGFQTFTTSGSFTVPAGVTSIRVLCVGGGGGGANGHQGGGGAGYVQSGTYGVTPGSTHTVTVGNGGNGALMDPGNNINGMTAGSASTFGSLLTANGGLVVNGINLTGNNGSSGGGGACNAGSPGGAGGFGGTNGGGCTYSGGTGQGNYTALLSIFVTNAFTAGAGGAGGNSSHSGGGGAGGVRMNGSGPNAGNGGAGYSGQGGQGYGSGGGGGGYNGGNREAGGNGAAGLVYIEW